MNHEASTYQPGICNIGPREIQKRNRIGYIGIGLTFVFIVAAEWFDFPDVWKMAIFAPIVYAVSGFVQARSKFCFLFGVGGISRVGEAYVRIRDDQSKSKDIRKSIILILKIIGISAAFTLLYVFLS